MGTSLAPIPNENCLLLSLWGNLMITTAANPLGELIVRRRAVLGLSQLELSARAAVDIKTLQGLEAGTTQRPRAVTLGKIAKVIGVDVADLLRLAETQSKKVNRLGSEAKSRQAGRGTAPLRRRTRYQYRALRKPGFSLVTISLN
jgi:transcriptional regulator with XRE-family HTH domain